MSCSATGPPADISLIQPRVQALIAISGADLRLGGERDEPARHTTRLSRRVREGRIFLDYLRNDRLATAIANFSPRARPGAPLAFPVSWAMVKPGLDPAGFRLSEMAGKRLPRDPWRGFDAAARPVTDAMRRLTQG